MDGLHRALDLIDGWFFTDRYELIVQDVNFAEERMCCRKRIKIDLLLGLQVALPCEEVVWLALDEELAILLCVMPRRFADGIDGRMVVRDDAKRVENNISVRSVCANNVAEMPGSIHAGGSDGGAPLDCQLL